ncbi:MAG: hypothetical protein IPM39_18355 [Chloroflexi bacterium]|nr:hypothetical protein [Chloroflexota bacterium]
MLKEVLHAIESANGPVHVAQLSRQLGIERSALDGMIAYWVRHGRLYDDATSQENACPPGHCGSTCTGAATCAFVAKMPKSYTVKRP